MNTKVKGYLRVARGAGAGLRGVLVRLVVTVAVAGSCLVAPVLAGGGGGAVAWASDPGAMLQYVPDSSLLFGVDVERVKDAGVYNIIVDLLIGRDKKAGGEGSQGAGAGVKLRSRHRIFTTVGFDPEKDLDALILSVRKGAGREVDHITGQTIFTEQDVLVLIKGRFDSAKVGEALQAESKGRVSSEEHKGVVVHLLKGARSSGKSVGLAISSGYLMMGGKDLVLQSIGLLTGGAGEGAEGGSVVNQGELTAMISKVSHEPAWFVIGKEALVLLDGGRSMVRNPLAAANEIYGTVGASDVIDIQMTIECESPQFALGMEQAVAMLFRSLASSPQSVSLGLNELLSGVSLAVVDSSVKVGVKVDGVQIGQVGTKLQPVKGKGKGKAAPAPKGAGGGGGGGKKAGSKTTGKSKPAPVKSVPVKPAPAKPAAAGGKAKVNTDSQ